MLLLEQKRISGNLETLHFVGIGGIGMSGIAEIMHNLGYKVQGSDITDNNNTKRLRELGIKIFSDHDASNISNVSYVIASTAISIFNPELQAALERKIPIIKRSEMLAEIMRLKCSIAISGSHGKTTTTSLISCLFEAAGLHPTVINGGIINNKATNAYLGSGDYLIAEADESDATFINIPSTIGIITNIDPEHMDFYQDFDNLQNSFKKFLLNLPFYGFGVACIDHPVVRQLIKTITTRKIITYGIESGDANIKAFNISSDVDQSTFDVKIHLPTMSAPTTIEKIIIPTPGKHNVLNSLAAIAIASELDFGIKVIQNGFKYFKGVKRRFTKVCKINGATIIDDYAHHPVEIRATLATAKIIAQQQQSKIIAIFQPHRYSRLKSLFQEFVDCFDDADMVYITEVYSAGEKEIDGVSAETLVKEIRTKTKHTQAKIVKSHEEIPGIITSKASPGDLVLMMGAGSISSWANNLLHLV